MKFNDYNPTHDIEGVLRRIHDALESGYAILSTAEREQAINKAFTAGVAEATGHNDLRDERYAESRALLQLPPVGAS